MGAKLEKLQMTLDEERTEFQNNLALRITGWSEKETSMIQIQMKQQKEIDRLNSKTTEIQKESDRLIISKQELENQLESKDDLVATLEESFEQAKF